MRLIGKKRINLCNTLQLVTFLCYAVCLDVQREDAVEIGCCASANSLIFGEIL
jgi:hypothetical protein